MTSAEGVMFNGAQTGNMVDSTTGAGQSIRSQALQERIRYDQPHTFAARDNGYSPTEDDIKRGYNAQAPDPAKYSVPSAAKDNYFTRQQILNAHRKEHPGSVQMMAPVGTDEEVALVEEMEAQQKIAQFDQYCASLFNYKNIPGGIEALERINPGFTSRRMAQIYADAAFAAKTRAIEMIGQINCTQEDNIFKMHLDNGLITGPTLARERAPAKQYMPGNFAKTSRPSSNMNALPGASNTTGYQPTGKLPAVFGTGIDGVEEMSRALIRPDTRNLQQNRVDHVNQVTLGTWEAHNGDGSSRGTVAEKRGAPNTPGYNNQ